MKPSPILDALNSESYSYLALQAPELIDAIEAELAAGRTPEQIRRIVSGHVGAEREALSIRCYHAACHAMRMQRG